MATAELFDMDKKRDGDKQKALDAALAQIERQFGKGSIMRLGGDNPVVGDRSRSRPARSGSTSRSASAACRGAGSSRSTVRKARARRRWRCTASPRRRRRAASAPSSTPSTRSIRSMRGSSASTSTNLLISQPDTGEQALEIVDTLVRSGAVDVVVVDSVAALMPRAGDRGRDGRQPRRRCRRG